MKELLVIKKIESKKDEKVKSYYLCCLKLVRSNKENEDNKILRNYVNGESSDYLVKVSEKEYNESRVGDVYSYTCSVNEYERIELVLGKIQKNIFGK